MTYTNANTVLLDSEFKRIANLPRKEPWSEEKIQKAVRLLTNKFKTPTGTMQLLPLQAQALVEAYDTGVFCGLMGAGSGKTLTSALLFTLLGKRRNLLLVPASLKEKTFDDWRDLQRHWNIFPLWEAGDRVFDHDKPLVRVLTYDSLQVIGYASYLEEYAPQVLVCDEAHFLANPKASRWKRVIRYLRKTEAEGSPASFFPMSGTFFRKSIKDGAHIIGAALKAKSPLPLAYHSLEAWSYAIDQGVKQDARFHPGPLLQFSENPTDASDLESIRRGVRTRIIQTPGIVASTEVSSSIPLVLKQRRISVPDTVREAMKRLKQEMLLPSGDISQGGVAAWNHAREIAAGFAYRWDPPAPQEWLEARSAWSKFVNEALRSPRIDTPLQVWNAVEAGRYGEVPEFNRWKELRDTFTPKTVPIWISDYLVKDAEKWAIENNGIVWVGHTAAYQADVEDSEEVLGKMFKDIPFFGAGNEGIKSHRGPCAASIRSHGTGKNLTQWRKALILSMPSSGKTLEQLIARHHRNGQKADLVEFHFYAQSLEMVTALQTAIEDAKYVKALTGQDMRVLACSLLDSDGHTLRFEDFEDDEDPMFQK